MSKQEKTGIIILPSLSACALFEHELMGQFSDGLWENATPHEHWKFWCRLEVKFDPTAPPIVQTDRPWVCKKTGYNIAALYGSSMLLADRMLAMGRMGRAVHAINRTSITRGEAKASEYMPSTLTGFILAQCPRGMSDYVGEHLSRINRAVAESFYATSYSMKDLKVDVVDIKTAMKSMKQLTGG